MTGNNSGVEPRRDRSAASTVVRYQVLAWLCLAAAISYVHRSCISVPANQIQEELGLNQLQMAWVMSGFFITYAIFQIPSGWLGDRWGSRRCLAIFSTCWSGATALMGGAHGFATLVLARLGNGLGQAGIFPCSVNTIARWFPDSERALPSGLLAGFMSWGAVFATALTAVLLDYLDWRALFIVLSLPGIAWSIGFYWWFRDRPEEHGAVNELELEHIRGHMAAAERPPAAEREPTPWASLVTSVPMALICLQQFFRAAGYVFYQTWFPKYLQETRNVSQTESGLLTSMTLAGVALGSMIGGGVADWIQRRTGSRRLARQGVAIVSLSGCALLILAAYFIEGAREATLVITLGSFCAGVAGPAAYTITIDMGGRHVATVFSTMNMAGNIGAATSPLLVAWLVGATGQNWSIVLMLFVVIYTAAACCWLFLNPRGTVFGTADAASDRA